MEVFVKNMNNIKRINLKQVEESFKQVDDENISTLGMSLINELKFMKQTLTQLKKEIKTKGVVTEMDQGKYTIERANPAITSYNTMVKNYNSTIKQIYELLSSSNATPEDNFEDDDLM